jgi:hypothetical protein
MSCNNDNAYGNICRQDIPYPQISHESVPSLIDNLVYALYGTITKSVVDGRVVWNIPCDPNNTTEVIGIPRLTGEGLLCYLIRCFDDFNQKYLGAFAVAPSGPHQEGALYFNTTEYTMNVWSGTTWIIFSPEFNLSDFDMTSGVVSINYTDAQASSALTKGFLTSTDWTTFNNKQVTITTGYIDNVILRSNGTGGSTLQNSAIIIDDLVVPFSTTGPVSTKIYTAIGNNFVDNQAVIFQTLTGGGSNIFANTIYFVRNIGIGGTDTFQLSTTSGSYVAISNTADVTETSTLIAIQDNAAISSVGSASNISLVLQPKGNGGIIFQKPDGTSVGGSFRGLKSVDFQLTRAAADQVAGGTNSVICGGQNNKIDNTGGQHIGAIIGGGIGNRVSNNGNGGGIFCGTSNSVSSQNSGAVICGGSSNTINTGSGFIGGGNGNASNGTQHGVIVGGINNSVSGAYTSVLGGTGNVANAISAVVCGGGGLDGSLFGNTASGAQSGVLSGWGAVASQYGQQAHSSGQFAANTATGDAQRSRFVLRCKTTTNSAVEMALDGGTTYLIIPSGKYLTGTINIAGIKSNGLTTARYIRQFSITNVSLTTTLIGAVTVIGADIANGTTIAITANDVNDRLVVSVTGITSETWRWVASVDVVEMAYGA